MTSKIQSTEKWPNFFIVGAAKAGTTSLHAYLNDIPGIYMSSTKEPKYFTVSDNFHYNIPPIRDKKKYLNLFAKAKEEKIIGEASPQYLRDPQTPKFIHQIVPQAKILISLRDPVERLYSSYLMRIRNVRKKTTFREEIDLVFNKKTDKKYDYLKMGAGLYSEYVKRYLKIFGNKQVKIIIFEEFIKNTKETINDILKFLDIKYEFQNLKFEVHNKSGINRGGFLARNIRRNRKIISLSQKILSPSTRRILRDTIFIKSQPKPKMDQKDREFLIKFYNDDVKNLQTLLGRKLPWKNFQN